MNVSSANNSLANLQLLQSLLSNPTKTSASDLEALFSKSLSSAKNSTQTGSSTDSSSTKSTDKSNDSSTADARKSQSMSMLKALLNFDSVSPLLAALNSSGSSGSGSDGFESLISSMGNSSSSDLLTQALGGTGSGGDIFSMLQNLQGASSGSGSEDSFYDSNFALVQALSNSGMSASQMTQVFNQVQANSQYNQRGTTAALDSTLPSFYSTTA